MDPELAPTMPGILEVVPEATERSSPMRNWDMLADNSCKLRLVLLSLAVLLSNG